jgi:hypothetical protein
MNARQRYVICTLHILCVLENNQIGVLTGRSVDEYSSDFGLIIGRYFLTYINNEMLLICIVMSIKWFQGRHRTTGGKHCITGLFSM